MTIKAWAGGGGGGRSDDGDASNSAAGGGGGGGGYRTGTFTVSAGQTITIVVGAGGPGGNSDFEAGDNGDNSSATHTSGTITANGGAGGSAGVNSTTGGAGGAGGAGSGGSAGFTGGTGAAGGTADGGKGGGGAGDAAGGGTGTGRTGGGVGGTASGGTGGNGGTSGASGADGGTYGGGGGGCGDNGSGGDQGGDGGDGAVILNWTCAGVNVSNFNVTAADVCNGGNSTVTITSNTLASGTYVVYYDLSGTNAATAQSASMVFNGGTDNGTFTTIALANSGTTTVTVTAVGCAHVEDADNLSVLAAVNYGTITSADQTFCAGSNDPSNISFSTAPSGSGSFSYQWYYQDGIVACPTGSSTLGWTLIGGATSNSYNPGSGLTASRTYACLVTPGGTPTCGTATWATGCRKVTVLPTLNYGTITSADETICTGGDPSEIAFSTAPSGSGSFTYQWYFQNGIVTCPTGSATAGWTSIGGATGSNYDPPSGLTGSRTYAVVVSPGGTPDCGTSAWASSCRKVTVVADPSAPTATKSPNVAGVCAGQTLTLTGVTDNGGGTGTCNIEYRSSTDGGANWTTWSTTLPSFAAVSGATNLIEVRKNCSGSGCDISPSSSYSWTVNPVPSCSISGPDPVCANTSGHVYSAPMSMSAYAWSIAGNGTIPGSTIGQTVSVNAGAAGTYTVTLTVTNSGCTSSCSKTVTVNALPTASISGMLSFCTGGSTVLTASGGTSYLWDDASTNAMRTITAANTYTVQVTDNNGCTDTETAIVTVSPIATADAGGPYTGCGTAQVTIEATTNGSGSWSGGLGAFASASSATTTYTPHASEVGGMVTLTWTTNDPDGGGPCASVNDNATLTIGTPAIAGAGGPYATCGATPVAITATASGAGMWSGGSGSFANAANTNTTYTPAMAEFGTTVTLYWTTNDPDGVGGCPAVTDNTSLAVSGQEIVVEGNGNSITNTDATPASADHTDFGWTTVAAGAITRTFTIQNTGSSALNLPGGTPVTLSGSGDFTVTLQPTSPVASGGGMTMFQIQFDPSSAGMHTATVSIANNDCDEAPFTFDIQGKGTIPQAISVFGNGNPISNRAATASVSDDTDFGSTGGIVSHTFTIYNVANGSPLNLTGVPLVTIADRDAADFTVTAQPASLIDGGSSTTFTIAFQPSATGLRTAQVIITHNDLPENPFVFTINGTGL